MDELASCAAEFPRTEELPRTGVLPKRRVGAALSIVWVKSAGLVTIRPAAVVTSRGFDNLLVLSTWSLPLLSSPGDGGGLSLMCWGLSIVICRSLWKWVETHDEALRKSFLRPLSSVDLHHHRHLLDALSQSPWPTALFFFFFDFFRSGSPPSTSMTSFFFSSFSSSSSSPSGFVLRQSQGRNQSPLHISSKLGLNRACFLLSE